MLPLHSCADYHPHRIPDPEPRQTLAASSRHLPKALAAIFFEPEQLAHEQQLLGTGQRLGSHAGRGAAGGDAEGGDTEAATASPLLLVPEFYRAKGLFDVAGSERMHALQAVQSTYELVEGQPWPTGEPHRSCVTFIGRNLPTRDSLRTALLACRAEGAA